MSVDCEPHVDRLCSLGRSLHLLRERLQYQVVDPEKSSGLAWICVTEPSLKIVSIKEKIRDVGPDSVPNTILNVLGITADLRCEHSKVAPAQTGNPCRFKKLANNFIPDFCFWPGGRQAFALTEHEMPVATGEYIDVSYLVADLVLHPWEPEEPRMSHVSEETACKYNGDDSFFQRVPDRSVKRVAERYLLRQSNDVPAAWAEDPSLDLQSRLVEGLHASRARADLPLSAENAPICPELQD